MSTTRRALDYRVDPFDLQLFAAVVEHGTITAAAQAMSLSLGAASTRIKTLEHRVGTKLLERSKAGAAVTDAGRALVRQAHRVLAELETWEGTREGHPFHTMSPGIRAQLAAAIRN